MQWLLMRLGRALGRKFYWYGQHDLADRPIKVCTRCGCHFVGESCPSNRHN